MTFSMFIVFLRIHPRLCAASAFKLLAVKYLHKSHLKPCFVVVGANFVDRYFSNATNFHKIKNNVLENT